ncbi:MAG: WYL domain-containing protein [Bacteriovorax sp.]|nr:WYL domain-containing protein [Bacteriovorax sp.]
MSDQQIILENSFWKFLVSLEELKERKELFLFCSSLGVDEETLDAYCEFLTRFKVAVMKDAQFVYPLKEQCRIKMEFTLSEWLALQASFPKESPAYYYQQIIHDKMQMAQKANAMFTLHKKADDHVISGNAFEHLKKKIDYDIVCRKSMKIEFFSHKECSIFPHRMVFLDGILCVVGENINDKMLVYFGVEDIANVTNLESVYEPNLSQLEVNEFIGHLRLINGKEERLVLKIYSQDQADLLPEHHFLGNPFVTTSTEGDMIWAATLEMCDDIFNWLYKMRDRVEVLDPGHVRKEFSHFCALQSENAGSKKAS